MSGSPVKRARLESLDAQEEEIFAKLEDGRPLVEIATESGCSRPFLNRWLTYTEERSARYDKARQTAAHSLADDIQHDASNTLKRAISGEASKIEVAAAKLKGDTQRWLAGRWNAKYAEDRGTNVSVSVDLGSAFLNVLRRGKPNPEAIERGVMPVDEVPLAEQRSEHVANTLGLPAPIEIEDVLGITEIRNPDLEPIKRAPSLDKLLADEDD
ncbi:hypothetical protein [Paraburkholderia terrae]|uniref:terminase small subunit-like protein n=1 Tax=Paraburkholderia terrae TaxID=311230 RepID=UPI00206E5C67|nr:hypothetical protein [Paraburkholderia terrae]BDC37907.1 hypothetical protein PTKU15_12040 [Paraburkholderia terrae]